MEIKKAIHLLNVIVVFVDETAFKFVFEEDEPFLSDKVLSWSPGEKTGACGRNNTF